MVDGNRAHYIHDDLLQKIEDKFWHDKDCLPTERELTEIYHVSRNTVREALKMLSSRGYITLRNRRPALINHIPKYKNIYRPVQVEEFVEIQEVRFYLESGIVDQLMENITEEDINKLEAINEKIMHLGEAEDMAKLDYEFHLTLISIAKNEFLRHVYLSSMVAFTTNLIVGKFSNTGVYAAYKTHMDIIETLKQKDKKQYLNVLDTHFKIGVEFLEVLKEQKLEI